MRRRLQNFNNNGCCIIATWLNDRFFDEMTSGSCLSGMVEDIPQLMIKESIGYTIRAEEQAIAWSRSKGANLRSHKLMICSKSLLQQVATLMILSFTLIDFSLSKEPAYMRVIFWELLNRPRWKLYSYCKLRCRFLECVMYTAELCVGGSWHLASISEFWKRASPICWWQMIKPAISDMRKGAMMRSEPTKREGCPHAVTFVVASA